METTFDIIEVLADGTRLWKGEVFGLSAALKQAEAMAKDSKHELRVVHTPTETVVSRWPAKTIGGLAAMMKPRSF